MLLKYLKPLVNNTTASKTCMTLWPQKIPMFLVLPVPMSVKMFLILLEVGSQDIPMKYTVFNPKE